MDPESHFPAKNLRSNGDIRSGAGQGGGWELAQRSSTPPAGARGPLTGDFGAKPPRVVESFCVLFLNFPCYYLTLVLPKLKNIVERGRLTLAKVICNNEVELKEQLLILNSTVRKILLYGQNLNIDVTISILKSETKSIVYRYVMSSSSLHTYSHIYLSRKAYKKIRKKYM